MRIRQRLSAEEGFGLVELMVALFVLVVAVVALLSVMITSIRSVSDQRSRTGATRVATEHLEQLRLEGFEALGALPSPQTTTVLRDGREYTLTTTIRTVLADDPDVDSDDPDDVRVRDIRTQISWTTRAGVRNAVYSTAVADRNTLEELVPIGGEAARQISAVDARPNPLTVTASGVPNDPIDVVAVLRGYDATALVQVLWTNDGGETKALTLTSADGGITWTGTIAATQVVRVVPEAADGGAGTGSIDFTVRAGVGEGLRERLYTLPVTGPVANPPVVQSATISTNPIAVSLPTGKNTCDKHNQCENKADITFEARVHGLATTDSVRLKYQLYNGTFQEQAMSYVGPSGTTGVTVWRVVVQRSTVKFKTGSNQPFTIQVTRNADRGTATRTLLHNVVAS